jgi:hypothetical protein
MLDFRKNTPQAILIDAKPERTAKVTAGEVFAVKSGNGSPDNLVKYNYFLDCGL